MRNMIASVAFAGLGAFVIGVPLSRAGQLPHLSEQCPGAAAWLNGSHDGLSPAELKKLKSIKLSDPSLAEELAERYARDQAAEQAVIKAGVASESSAEAMKSVPMEHLLAVQKADLEWLEPIVGAHGFPTVQQVGLKGVEHAWMLVQHADMDRKFQGQVLADLKPRLTSEPFLRGDYALLMDRVRLAENKQQIYGTQFTTKNGRMVMQSTEDPARLDTRRASMGLMPIADYRCFLHVLYRMRSHSSSSPAAKPSSD